MIYTHFATFATLRHCALIIVSTCLICGIAHGKIPHLAKQGTATQLSGDESHQGRHLRIPAGQFGSQRIKLYRDC